MLRVMVAHETAARVQKKSAPRGLRSSIAALGPGAIAAAERSGAITLALIDGVERLEVYFGQFLPQFLVSLLAPVLIFVAIAFIDLPVAVVMLGVALGGAVRAGALAQARCRRIRPARRRPTAAFAAEFLDLVQGLATLKAFGQSGARGEEPGDQGAGAVPPHHVGAGHSTCSARGITDSADRLRRRGGVGAGGRAGRRRARWRWPAC